MILANDPMVTLTSALEEAPLKSISSIIYQMKLKTYKSTYDKCQPHSITTTRWSKLKMDKILYKLKQALRYAVHNGLTSCTFLWDWYTGKGVHRLPGAKGNWLEGFCWKFENMEGVKGKWEIFTVSTLSGTRTGYFGSAHKAGAGRGFWIQRFFISNVPSD